MRCSAIYLLICGAAWFAACKGDRPIPEIEIGDNRVDLRLQQTAIKNQGSRNTCISFATIAALEAAYLRMGYGHKDLSEEFLNYMGKNLWLHHNSSGRSLWSEIERKGADGPENQMAAFAGGGSAGLVRQMYLNGMKVPYETEMPYVFRESDFESNAHYFPYSDIEGKKQRNYSDFNLDTANIPHHLLHAAEFHGAFSGQFYEGSEARDTDLIESILRRRLEVVWDFAGRPVTADSIWRPAQEGEAAAYIAHAMLIVGFDKTDRDPKKHYFIVKNSWGRNERARSGQGFTYISYDMIREMGTAMAYIELPITNLQPWPELQVLGRYSINFDGHKGQLDIYHIPGYWKETELGMRDHRLGSLYVNGGIYRVNGSINGNKVTFYFDTADPNMQWDKLSGRKFEYYYHTDGFMAGFHTNTAGIQYAGYARKMGFWGDGASSPKPLAPSSYAQSAWEVHLGGWKGVGTLELRGINPNEGETLPFYEIEGDYSQRDGALTTFADASLQVPQAGDRAMLVLSSSVVTMNASLDVGHLTYSPGVMAGYEVSGDVRRPVVMIRK
ncbi:MAG: hypothetical protein EAS52_16945 [Parapedobacter sp.]|nr:MAG: hypothetical protein EAS52_16945 [Parapedobacter sp.]